MSKFFAIRIAVVTCIVGMLCPSFVEGTCDLRRPPTKLSPAEKEYTGDFMMTRTPFGTYFNDVSCHWLITCPSGYRVALALSIKTVNSNDNFTIFNKQDRSTVLAVVFGHRVYREVFPLHSVYVLWRADSTWVAEGMLSPAVFGCYRGCTALPHNQVGKKQSKTVESDGYSFGVSYMGDSCEWQLRCLNGNQEYLYFTTLTNSEGLTVEDSNGVAISFREYERVPSNILVKFQSVEGSTFAATVVCTDANVIPAACEGTSPALEVTDVTLAPQLSAQSRYFNHQFCSWNFSCPAGLFLAYDIDISAPYDEGYLLYDAAKNKTKKAPRHQLLRTSEAIIQFSSGYLRDREQLVMTKHGPANRYTSRTSLRVECLATNCSTNTTNSTEVVFQGVPKIVGTSRLFETCSWLLKCSNETWWVVFDQMKRRGGELLLRNRSGHLIPFIADQPYTTQLGYMHVFFMSNHSADSFSVRFTCAEPICKPGEFIYYRGKRVFNLSVPTDASGLYFNNLRCQWEVECPAGFHGMLFTGAVYTISPDNMTVIDPGTGNFQWKFEGYDPGYRGNHQPEEFEQFFPYGKLHLHFFSNSYLNAPGFPGSIFVECYASTCSTNTTEIPHYKELTPWCNSHNSQCSARPRTIEVKYPGEHCQFSIACNDTSMEIYFIQFSLERKALTMLMPSGEKIERKDLPDSSRDLFYHHYYYFTYNSTGQSPLTIEYSCHDRDKANFCRNQQIIPAAPGQTITFPNIDRWYLNNVTCHWQFECPSQLNIGIYGKLFLHNGEFVEVWDEDDNVLLHLQKGEEKTGTDTETLYIADIFSRSKVSFHFSSDQYQSAPVPESLSYECYVGNCSSNITKPRVVSHEIGTEGAMISTKFFNEDCSWILMCNDPRGWITYSAASNAGIIYDFYDCVNVTYYNTVLEMDTWRWDCKNDTKGISMTHLASGRKIGNPKIALMVNSLPVLAKWDPPEYSRIRMSFIFACFLSEKFLTSACAPNAVKVLEPYEGQFFPIQTPWNTYYNELLCKWKVQCPTGWSIKFNGTVRTWNEIGMDGDKFAIFRKGGELLGRYFSTTWVDDKTKVRVWVDRRFQFIVTENEAFITFQSDFETVERGFLPPGLSYGCISTNCSTNSTEPIKAILYNASEPRVIGNTYDFESCEWILRCADRSLFMVFKSYQNVYGGTVQAFDDEDDTMPIPNIASEIPLSFMRISYVNPGYFQRFSMEFVCFKPFQFSACSRGDPEVFADEEGWMDLPMKPNKKYGNFLQCVWEIRCPSAVGSIELDGTLVTHSDSDYFTVSDTQGVQLYKHFTNDKTYNISWHYLIRLSKVIIHFYSDDYGTAAGLLRPFNYHCHPRKCSELHSREPVLATATVINISTNMADETCEWMTQCTYSTWCLVFTDISKSMKGVWFTNMVDSIIDYEQVSPIILPVNKLRVHLNRFQRPNEGFHFAFKCVPPPKYNFCNENNNNILRRLWLTFTAEPSPSYTIVPTPSASITTTHQLTESAGDPRTSTPSSTRTPSLTVTVTPPPTPTRSLTATLMVTGSFTITNTWTLGETLTSSSTPSTTFTASTSLSRSISHSMVRPITFLMRPFYTTQTAIRGASPQQSRKLLIAIHGTTIKEPQQLQNVSSYLLHATVITVSRLSGKGEEFGFEPRRGNLWVENAITYNASHITYEVPNDDGYYINEDETITLFFPREIFRHGENVKVASTRFIVVDDIKTKRPSVEESRAMVASLGSATLGSAAQATQASRLMLIAKLAACSFAVDEPLDFLQYPLGMPIGASKWRYYIGAMILNPVLLLIFLAVHAFIAYIVSALCQTPFSEAIITVYFPSFEVVPLLFLMQDSLGALFTVFFHADNEWRIVACMMFIVAPWGVLFVIFYRFFFVDSRFFLSWYEEDRKRNPIVSFFIGSGDWNDGALFPDKSKGFTRKYGQLFEMMRESRYWFNLIEMAMCVALGIISAIHPPQGHCDVILWVTFGVMCIYFVLVVLLAPFLAPFEQIWMIFVAILQCVGVGLFSAAQKYDEVQKQDLMAKGMTCMEIVTFSLIAKVFNDVFWVIYQIIQNWKENAKAQQKKERRKYVRQKERQQREMKELKRKKKKSNENEAPLLSSNALPLQDENEQLPLQNVALLRDQEKSNPRLSTEALLAHTLLVNGRHNSPDEENSPMVGNEEVKVGITKKALEEVLETSSSSSVTDDPDL